VEFPEIASAAGAFRAAGFLTPAGFGRRINLFGHTGSLLAYAALLAFWVYRAVGMYRPGAGRRILDGTLRRVMPSSVSILSMITMAVIMEHTGMTDILARGLAESAGGLFPLISPWIGAVGAFMTGSNTNSNVVFGALQQNTAALLGLPAALILAAQTCGAGLASVAAPAKVVVGASTAGMAGKEGEVLRKLALYTLILVLWIGALTALGVWLAS
jgi:lactate permease